MAIVQYNLYLSFVMLECQVHHFVWYPVSQNYTFYVLYSVSISVSDPELTSVFILVDHIFKSTVIYFCCLLVADPAVDIRGFRNNPPPPENLNDRVFWQDFELGKPHLENPGLVILETSRVWALDLPLFTIMYNEIVSVLKYLETSALEQNIANTIIG